MPCARSRAQMTGKSARSDSAKPQKWLAMPALTTQLHKKRARFAGHFGNVDIVQTTNVPKGTAVEMVGGRNIPLGVVLAGSIPVADISTTAYFLGKTDWISHLYS